MTGQHWNSHGLPALTPIERLALVEHHVAELAESLNEARESLNNIAARLWFLSLIEELASLIKNRVLAVLGRAVEVMFYVAMVYLAAQAQWITTHAPALPGQ